MFKESLLQSQALVLYQPGPDSDTQRPGRILPETVQNYSKSIPISAQELWYVFKSFRSEYSSGLIQRDNLSHN